MDIEQLATWAYAVQKAGPGGSNLYEAEALADGIVHYGHSADGVWVCQHLAELGAFVDGRAGPWALHPDAEVIDQAVRALDPIASSLVMVHGTTQTRPVWGEGLRPRVEPVWKSGPRYDPATGLPAARSFEVMRRGQNAVACLVRHRDPPEYLEALRTRYATWHGALEALVGILAGRLEQWEPTGPAAPAEPWAVWDSHIVNRPLRDFAGT